MGNTNDGMKKIEMEFRQCQQVLVAIGNETRQHILCTMMGGNCSGERVLAIAKAANLSRPSVSHHLQILKEAGIVKSRKEGTLVYYYLDPDAQGMEKLITLLLDVRKFMQGVPDRQGEDA